MPCIGPNNASSGPRRCNNPECNNDVPVDAPPWTHYCSRKCRSRMNALGISITRGDADARDLGPARPQFGMTEKEARAARMRNALNMLSEGIPIPTVLDAYPSITEDALKKAASRKGVRSPGRDWLPAGL